MPHAPMSTFLYRVVVAILLSPSVEVPPIHRLAHVLPLPPVLAV